MPEFPTVAQASRRLISGEVSSEKLVEDCLARIKARDSIVRAWEHLDIDQALAAARKRDSEVRRSLIHGVPVAIKDVFDTAAMPTTYGAAPFKEHRPNLDSAAVAMLRRAGAVIMGKTKTTEFATFHPADTANPHHPDHTPGGSSSGSAAAVADGMVPAATGTQTMGSVIRPAAYCGVVGYKPSFGAIARSGLAMLSESNDTVGLFARSVEDLPLLMSALVGVEPEAFLEADRGAPVIGLFRGPDSDLARGEAVDALVETERAFATAGAEIREIECPVILMRALQAHMTITQFEMARNLAAVRLDHGDDLSDRLSGMLQDGAAIPYADYLAAQDIAAQAREAVAEQFGAIDMFLTFPAPGPAPKGLDSTGDPIFNRLWSLMGTPCVTLPVLQSEAGLPVGIQLVGPVRQDARFLALAGWAERALAAR